ncbi:amino acid permease [Candidatus Woesearchaeota archaeon]|nr:amino acid permease [Candidatus Woesearchaeota archaeon]
MTELQRVLSFRSLLLITVVAIMGTGVFFLPAVGAQKAGPQSIISWLLLSFIALYIASCFAELASMYPKAGGIYEFCKHTFGRFWSFVIGWTTLVVGNITIAMLVVGAIRYILPYKTNASLLCIGPVCISVGVGIIILSLFFIWLFNAVAYRGMKTSSVMLITFSLITLSIVGLLIVLDLWKADWSNLRPFFVKPASSIYLTLFFIAETFFGWETITFLAEETKNPEKAIPKALVYGTVLIAVLVLLFVISSMGVMPWQEFGQSTVPLADLAMYNFGPIGKDIFTLLVYVSIIGTLAGWIVAAPRLVLALAKDKLFLATFAKIHPKYHTPYKAIMFQAVLTSFLVLMVVGKYQALLILLIPMVLMLYSAVLLSVVILRLKKPAMKRPFKAPWGKYGPLAVILFNISLIIIWLTEEPGAAQSFGLGISLIGLGIPFYLLLELYYDPKFIRKTNNLLAYVALLTESIFLPRKVRKEIVELIGNVKGKTVLEFGCGVGGLTLHLARAVGPRGKIYATDISEKEIELASRRLKKNGNSNIRFIHDVEHGSRVHEKVPKVHVIVSAGQLGYVQKIRKVLKEMNQRLDKEAKICFVDYDKFFDIIPNIEWLSSDKEIIKLFSQAGFEVMVERKQGFAWKYIYIYGRKAKDL